PAAFARSLISFLLSSRGLSSRRCAVDGPGALHSLANYLDFCVAPKDGLTIGPGKRRRNLACLSDGRTGRRLIAQVRPLQVEGVSVMDPDAGHRVGSRAPERKFGALVAI